MRQFSRRRIITASLFALAVFYYAFCLTDGHPGLFWSLGTGQDMTFNSMLEHLLRGEFDVDPNVVGDEGFARDGRVFAYWGIFFAVIRWPLTLFRGGLRIDATYLSCLVAVCIAAYAKLCTLRLVFSNSPTSAVREILYWAMLITILFAGPQAEFLRATIFQEVCLWAGALAAIFVYLAVRGILMSQFSASSLSAMALIAGLALLARVSTGIGLYAAIVLCLAIALRKPDQGGGAELAAQRNRLTGKPLASVQLLPPMLVLIGFCALTGFVNYSRWGDPLTFANYNLYLTNAEYPDWVRLTQVYGLFNLSRIPFGIIYYFAPIWVLHRPDGHLLFEEHQRRLIESTELPPSTFFLTDPLLILLMLYAVWSLLRAHHAQGINRLHILAIGIALAVPGLLMLCAISMNFRYRIEFYPLIEFGAFLGFLLLNRAQLQAQAMRRLRAVALVSTSAGVLASQVVLIMYKVSNFGPGIERLQPGVLHYYWRLIRWHYQALFS